MNYQCFPGFIEFHDIFKGKILYGMTNDYMFHAVLQSNNKVLYGQDYGETRRDKKYRLDQWAALFKAETWENLKMISANDEYLTEAAETIYQLNADKYVLKLCQDRDEYYNDIRYYQNIIAEKDKSLAEKDNIISRLLTEIELLKSSK